MAAATVMLEQQRLRRARRWTRDNLFSNRWNSALTIATVAFTLFVGLSLLRFVFSSADWTVVDVNMRLLMLGRYPQSEEWRLWPPLWAIFALSGASFGFWLPIGRRGAFVAAVAADYALVSAGYRNRWGLPRPEVVERWHETGAEVLSTPSSGAISLRLCADGGIREISRNRDVARRMWHE